MMQKAKKELGQNFLRNTHILESIVGAQNLSDSHVIEIGPGLGDLTERIFAHNPKSVTLVEIDPEMIQAILLRFPHQSYTVYQHDILDTDICL